MRPFNTLSFAQEWLEAWKARDLEAILSHYAENIEFTSPFALQLAPESGGTLRGKAELRAYFARALETYPEFPFELLHHTKGVRSVTLIYRSINDLVAAEMMEADDEGKISRVWTHYGESVTD